MKFYKLFQIQGNDYPRDDIKPLVKEANQWLKEQHGKYNTKLAASNNYGNAYLILACQPSKRLMISQSEAEDYLAEEKHHLQSIPAANKEIVDTYKVHVRDFPDGILPSTVKKDGSTIDLKYLQNVPMPHEVLKQNFNLNSNRANPLLLMANPATAYSLKHPQAATGKDLYNALKSVYKLEKQSIKDIK